jgi:hypothetical protein
VEASQKESFTSYISDLFCSKILCSIKFQSSIKVKYIFLSTGTLNFKQNSVEITSVSSKTKKLWPFKILMLASGLQIF